VEARQIRGSAGYKVQRKEKNILGARNCDFDLTVRETLPGNLSLNKADLSLAQDFFFILLEQHK